MSRPTHAFLGCLALLWAWGPFCTPTRGQTEAAPKFEAVEVGVAGAYKLGQWTQAVLTLRGGSQPMTGQVWVVVPDGDGVESRFVAQEPCRLQAHEPTQVVVSIRPGRQAMWLRAGFEVEGRLAAQAQFACQSDPDRGSHAFAAPRSATAPLYLAIGSEGLPLEQMLRDAGAQQLAAEVARVSSPARLPLTWYGYEGFEAIFLCTGHPGLSANWARSEVQIAALEQWISLGGTLVLCVGSQADAVLGAGAPLARLAPGKLQEMVTLQQTGAWETYARSSVAMPSGPELRVPRLAEVQGVVEAREVDLPLVVRTARGLGQVVFVAADVDRGRLAAWKGRADLIRRLLDLPLGPQEEAALERTILDYGVFDLSGQLRQALDHFPTVRLVPFWLVAVLLAGYLVLIGPVDYYFLRKVVGRMELTWITFPLLVLAVSVGVYALGQWAKGDRVHLSQAELVDVDLASGLTRGTLWADLFSPDAVAYDISAQPALPGAVPIHEPQWITSWLGLPGQGLGGMSSANVGSGLLWDRSYQFTSDLSAMQGVPVGPGGSKGFTVRWCGKAEQWPRIELRDDGQVLAGQIRNALPCELQRAVLVYRQWAYDLGDLRPGQALDLGATSKRSELKTYLTGRRLVPDEGGNKYRQVTDPWDRGGADIPLILRTMMFYEAAGGQRYTGLPNRYQSFVDLSAALQTQRAILVARVPAADGGSRVLGSGQVLAQPGDTRVTLFRFLIPVAQASQNP